MDGVAPLSYGTVKAWAELMDIHPTPLEVQALIILDSVIRNPNPVAEPEPVTDTDAHAWPEKK
jgi:hypothetical protein